MKTVVISDLHLGSSMCQAEELLKLLEDIRGAGAPASGAKRLILNGDVFDNHDFRRLCKNQWKVLSQIRKMSDDIDVIWVVGNHDGPLDVISPLLGVEVYNEYVLHSNGVRLLVHHGDIHDKFLLKYPWLTCLADLIYHGAQRINYRFAQFLKRGSKTYTRNTTLVRERALAMVRRRKFDGAICGHTHFPETCVVDGLVYGNSGSWAESPCSYLIVDKGKVDLHFTHESPHPE